MLAKRYIYSFLIFLSSLWTVVPNANAISVCASKDYGLFDPAIEVEDRFNRIWAGLLFDRLIEYDGKNQAYRPGLVESWEVNNDGTIYRFSLRPDVAFHDNHLFSPTRNLNSDDVLFTFRRLLDPEHPLHQIHDLEFSPKVHDLLAKDIKEVRKLSEYKFDIVLHRPNSELINALSQDYLSILSKEYGDFLIENKRFASFHTLPIGSGPYRLKAYHRDVLMNFRPFDLYWGDMEGYAKNILILPTPSEAMRLQKLQLAECYIIPALSLEAAANFKENSEVKMVKKSGKRLLYIAYNTKWAPLNKTLVRRGLTMAVNKQIISQAVFNGLVEVAHSPVPSNIWGHDGSLTPYEYSPTFAREQYTDARSSNIDFTLWIQNEADGLIPDPILLGEILKADWALTGVEVTVEAIDKDLLLDVAKDQTRPGAVLLWANSQDGTPEDYLNKLLRCDQPENYARWCFAPFEENLDVAAREPDLTARVGYYQRAQQIFHEQTPWTPLVSNFQYIASRRNVQNYGSHNVYNLRGVTLGATQ